MTTYMLDTHIVSFAFKSRPPQVVDRLRQIAPAQTCVSAITVAELRFGADKSAAAGRYHGLIDEFLMRVRVIPFSRRAADLCGRIRADLTSRGRVIGPLDMLIAASALAEGAVLVTNNLAEFERVPGLNIEDWAA